MCGSEGGVGGRVGDLVDVSSICQSVRILEIGMFGLCQEFHRVSQPFKATNMLY